MEEKESTTKTLEVQGSLISGDSANSNIPADRGETSKFKENVFEINEEKFANEIIRHEKTENSQNPLPEYKAFDNQSISVTKKLERRKKRAPKTVLQMAEESKFGIERRLEDTDKQLSDLIILGNEMVTNIKVANEKREVTRRQLEAIKRDELLKDLDGEQAKAMERYEAIKSKWSELKNIKEPMGLYEQMEEQKARIEALMNQKDNFIVQCENEIKRVDARYYEDLERQGTDIYCLVERINNQVELMKKAYSSHLELLQRTIQNERETLAMAAERKWKDIFQTRIENEKKKYEMEKQKAKFYSEQIEHIAAEHEEITRITRIRLERDAENLQLELRQVKNNVLLNAEKLDYNYHVLQKRDEENAIIRNQQKKRLAKMNETIANLKRRIKTTKEYSQNEMNKLSREVRQMHSSTLDLEAKTNNFKVMNDKKYQTVWDINFQEVLVLVNKALNIDKILHEEQLGLDWVRPDIPYIQMKDLHSYQNYLQQIKQNSTGALHSRRKSSQVAIISKSGKAKEASLKNARIMRSLVRKISDRAGFLVESKLLKILEPFSEEEKTLVRIDNIFEALDIKDVEDINTLLEYFLPYSWCPNCSKNISPSIKGSAHQIEEQDSEKGSEDFLELKIQTMLHASETTLPECTRMKTKSEEIQDYKRLSTEATACNNHIPVAEPVLILTALRKFAEDHFCSKGSPESEIIRRESSNSVTLSRSLSKEDVSKFWSQFLNTIPHEKQKLWKALEHGLSHFLLVLRERESLDTQCEFLRKQNNELQHLLHKYTCK